MTIRSEVFRRTNLFRSLFIEAHPVWVFIGCVLFAYFNAEIARSYFLGDWFFAFGKALELLGLIFIVLEIVSVRKQAGMPGFVNAIATWIKKLRWLIVNPRPIAVHMSGMLGGLSMSARARLTAGSATSKLTDRVEALETNLASVHKELDQIYGLVETAEKSATTRIDENTALLSDKIVKFEQLIAGIAAGDSAIKLVGVLLVLTGFVMQNLSNNLAPPPLSFSLFQFW
jgi:hypothetical protein